MPPAGHDSHVEFADDPTPPGEPVGGDGRRPVDRFEQIFSEIDDGYCLCEIIRDDTGRAVDYRFLEVNRNFERMTGLVNAVGRTALELVPDLEDRWIRTYGRAAAGERLRFQQGSEAMGRWFDVFTMPVGEPGQFGIVFRDETLRHRALMKLQASEERYRRLAEREHQISLRLQRALMPANVVQHPSIAIDVHYEAGSDIVNVGGDWFDTYWWAEREAVGVIVGDVVGHGLEAAAAMGRMSAAARAIASFVDAGPGAVLEHVARFAAGRHGVEYMTACSAVLDPVRGRLAIASAGHPPPLLIPPDGEPRWVEGGRSRPLGASVARDGESPSSLPEAVMSLDPGTRLLIFTDGLVERRGEPIDAGLERLRAVVAETAREAEVGGEVFCATVASRMLGAALPNDDIIALTLHYLG